MDPRERIDDLRVAITAALDGRQSQIWTSLPATIISYDASTLTAQVQPTILIQWNNPLTGGAELIQMPPISDCPVIFPQGGGYLLTFPIMPGDECLVNFASRCIDGWWDTGLISPQGDLRMHDLSDGFVTVGPRSRQKAQNLTGVSTSKVQLRTEDGNSYLEIGTGGEVKIKSALTVTVQSDVSITLSAPANTITANGNVLG